MMTQEAFDILDEIYVLIPQQDLGDGTYEWVCNYAGGKFYTRVDDAVSVWFPQGI